MSIRTSYNLICAVVIVKSSVRCSMPSLVQESFLIYSVWVVDLYTQLLKENTEIIYITLLSFSSIIPHIPLQTL
jgi:hypothetical protein